MELRAARARRGAMEQSTTNNGGETLVAVGLAKPGREGGATEVACCGLSHPPARAPAKASRVGVCWKARDVGDVERRKDNNGRHGDQACRAARVGGRKPWWGDARGCVFIMMCIMA